MPYLGTKCSSTDKHVVGAVYWCSYWQYFYLVTAYNIESGRVECLTFDGPATVGRNTSHYTGLDRRDSRIL